MNNPIWRVAQDPVAAMAYIREFDNEAVSFSDVASNLSVDMNKTDFAEVVAACRLQFGCGRRAVRIVDQRHLHESKGSHPDPRTQSFWIVGVASRRKIEDDKHASSMTGCMP